VGQTDVGTYWVWDARLTSFLLLLFLYLGYMALWNAIEDEIRAARAAAILALVGAVNIPVIQILRRLVEYAASGAKASSAASWPGVFWRRC